MLFGTTPFYESHWIFWSPIDKNVPKKTTFINYNTHNLTSHTTLLDYSKTGEKHNNFKAMKKVIFFERN
jgi:hypothetical protein